MNNTLAEARALVAAVREGLGDGSTAEVGIAPSAVLLMPMCRAIADSPIQLGAQNVYCEPSGAFTGETSPAMLVDAGCRFVIVGHSERRAIFGESGDLLRRKVAAAIDAGLNVIYCLGETLDQREQGETNDVLERQLAEVLVDGTDWRKITVATNRYGPSARAAMRRPTRPRQRTNSCAAGSTRNSVILPPPRFGSNTEAALNQRMPTS